MRGSLLAGPLGHRTTLERVAELARERPPVVVLSALWLAEALASSMPVAALIESDVVRGARRALRRARDGGQHLLVAAAGEELPVRAGAAGTLLLEGLGDIEQPGEAAEFLARLARHLRPDGQVVALEATKSPAVEARLAALFLSAALTGIVQERPREGAVLTIAAVPSAAVLAARLGGA
jgi:hypothetical protein